MNFWKRFHKVATGFGGALQAPFGLIKDVLSAPFVEDEVDGFVNSLYTYTKNRGGQLLGNTFGPEEGLGALAGGLPMGIRDPARAVLEPVGRGLETAYREGIARPLSRSLYAQQQLLNERRGLGESLRLGNELARGNADPGQALAFGLLDKDPTDPAQVTEAMNSDWFEIISGTSDAIFRLGLDPGVLAGKAKTQAVRARRAIDSPEDVARVANSKQLRDFNEALEGKDAGYIRDRWFSGPNYRASGGVISSVLAQTTNKAERYTTLRALVGDKAAIEDLRVRRADLAGQIERLSVPPTKAMGDEFVTTGWTSETGPDGSVTWYPPGTRTIDREAIQKAKQEVDAIFPEFQRLQRTEAARATVNWAPRAREGAVRTRITRSDFWQANPLAKPVRVVTEMMPQRLVNLHDASGDISLKRFLQRSALTLEQQDQWRARYMEAGTPSERQVILTQAEEAAVASIAARAGMDTSDINILLAGARNGRQQTASLLQSRAYDAKGRSVVRYIGEDGAPTEIHLPLWVTQEANVHALPDLDEVWDATTSWGRFRLHNEWTRLPPEALDSFYRLWRPATLLRFGWPIRVVADEQLRIIAKVGALSWMQGLARAAPEVANKVENLGLRQLERVTPGGVQRRLRPDAFDERPVLNRAGPVVNGYEMEASMGAPGDMRGVWAELVSSNASFRELVGQRELDDLAEMRAASGQFRSFEPSEPDYAGAWEWAVNQQIAQDTMGKMLLRGKTVDEVVDWMTSDPKGQAYAARLPYRRNLRAWAEQAEAQVLDYLPTPELRQLALKRTAKADDLARDLPDANDRPMVHGAILMETLGRGYFSQKLSNITQRLFDALGRTPTDVLSRNPFFDHMYRAEVSRLVRILDDGDLSPTELRRIEVQAREYALGETRNLLYDLAEKSRFGEMVRSVMPFYVAWQETLTRWAGLAWENPAFIRRAHLIWNAPEKAGIVVDGAGNPVGQGEPATDDERYYVVPLPEWVKDIPGMKGLSTQGAVKFNKRSFNIALQGWPGFGPPVQIPVNEIVKDRPDLESSLKFVLPFGSTQEFQELVLPAWGRRVWQVNEAEENRVYANTAMRIFNDKMVDFNLGRRTEQPTWEEARKETDKLFAIRVAANILLPAAPTFASPYQVFIDAYRQARERWFENPDALMSEEGVPRTPEEWFLDTYGPAYFPLTESLSKSVDGVPPTVESWRQRKEHADLIARYPEYGGLIVGRPGEGAGKFSGAVYDAQFANRIGPGTTQTQRRTKTPEEAQAGPNVRLGWIEYGRMMDLIESERVQRGLPNLNVKAAADLRAVKQALTAELAQRFPEWYDDFQIADEGRWRKRIAAFEEIVADPRLNQRDEFKGLAQYLTLRKLLVQELGRRKSKTLSAKDNADLAFVWQTMVGEIVESNLAFGELYYRWLERDPVELTVSEKVAA